METLLAKHPVRFAAAVSLAVAFVLGVFVQAMPRPVEEHPVFILAFDAARYLLAIGLVLWLGWWHRVRLARVRSSRSLLPFLPLAALPLLELSGVKLGTHDLVLIVLMFETALAAGFTEEVLFRGVVLRALERLGLIQSAIISSLSFGLIHLVNVLSGVDPLFVGLQVVYAALLGFSFAAVVLITNAIWPAIVIHFAINFISFLSTGKIVSTEQPGREDLLALLGVVALTSLLATYGFWLLRREHRRANEQSVVERRELVEGV